MKRISRLMIFWILLFASDSEFAVAQAYSYYRPHEPSVPSGYSMSDRDIERTEDKARRYVADMKDYIECIVKEHDHASRELDSFADRIDRLVEELDRR